MLTAPLRRSLFALLFLVALTLLGPLVMQAAAERYSFTTVASAPSSEVAIVLGASVAHGVPSPILAARAETAVDLYLAGKVKKILMTGDNGALTHDEVTPVRKYLLAAGVRAEDIFLDHAGFDTYSSMYRARAVFGVMRATVVTQAYHLPRALFIARSLGLEANGVAAEGHVSLYEYVREIPASWKALLDLMTRRQPKYLGPSIPIVGDGQGTWY